MTSRLVKVLALVGGAILILVLAAPTTVSLTVGGIAIVLGESIRIWASGHLLRNREVTNSGPYAYVRDPLYLGRLFIVVGLCIMAWGYSLLVLPLALLVFYFDYMPRKHRREMSRLENLFGEEYTNYAAYARSLLPRLKPYPESRLRPWSFALFWNENREQYLVLALLLMVGILVYRADMPGS